MASKRPGRKRLPLSVKRRNTVQVYLSDSELRDVRSRAKDAGETPSAFLRRLVVNDV